MPPVPALFQMPNYHEMNFRTYREVVPIVKFWGDIGLYDCARKLWGEQNEKGPEDGLGWLVPVRD